MAALCPCLHLTDTILVSLHSEFHRWCPSLRPLKFHGSKEEREELVNKHLRLAHIDEERDWDVLITTYEVGPSLRLSRLCHVHCTLIPQVAIIEKTHLSKIPFHYLVIDEAHRIKNEKSTLSSVSRASHCVILVLLTGQMWLFARWCACSTLLIACC